MCITNGCGEGKPEATVPHPAWWPPRHCPVAVPSSEGQAAPQVHSTLGTSMREIRLAGSSCVHSPRNANPSTPRTASVGQRKQTGIASSGQKPVQTTENSAIDCGVSRMSTLSQGGVYDMQLHIHRAIQGPRAHNYTHCTAAVCTGTPRPPLHRTDSGTADLSDPGPESWIQKPKGPLPSALL